MLSRLKIRFLRSFLTSRVVSCNFSQPQEISLVEEKQEANSLINTKHLQDDLSDLKFEKRSVLEPCTEDISHVAPYLKPSFNLAAYVNKSETLQQLIQMGVNLNKIERKVGAPQYILRLDFETNIKPHILFFHDLGMGVEVIANCISKNPFILREDIADLQVRINYLLSKKFPEDGIRRILTMNYFWLMFSTERIDRRLGFFQKEFSLSGNEVRQLATKQPKLITYNIQHVKENIFAFKEEMGFVAEEIKSILLNKPTLFMKSRDKMITTFEYVHNHMNIPLDVIAKFPEVLSCREFRLKERHLFLKELGRDQFDPTKPNYVSLSALISGENSEFAVNVAKSSVITYNTFLKTL